MYGEDDQDAAAPEESGSALSRAADMGALPGIHDSADDAEGDGDEETPIGMSVEGEGEQYLGFRGMR
jgi:hypothetical protein